jgi:nucleoid-associated protein YgaU
MRFAEAEEMARKGLAALASIPGDLPLPKYYVVRLIPGDRDTLSKIAGYPFVYGNPFLWTLLFEANKDLLVDPTNPHLILPGQVLLIPSASGEYREGTWDPMKTYPAYPL